MKRLTRGAIREARNILTLTRDRSSGSGVVAAVGVPTPTAQNEMMIANATPAWALLTAPTAEGQAIVTGASPFTPAWSTTPTWTGLHTFNAGITFGGAMGVNVITVPDNVAQAVHVVDAGGIEYLRIVSTNAQPVVVFNESGADVDHRIEASGQANALFVQGSSGNIGMGTPAPAASALLELSSTTGVLLLTRMTTAQRNALTAVNGMALYNSSTASFNYRENGAWVGHSGTFALYFIWPEPLVETVGQIRVPWDCTVTRVDGNIIGGTSCMINIEERGTLGSAGTNILSSDMVADANGESVTSSFGNSSLAAGNYLAYDISAVSGAVNFVSITITGTID